jgi:hypothetical protein
MPIVPITNVLPVAENTNANSSQNSVQILAENDF